MLEQNGSMGAVMGSTSIETTDNVGAIHDPDSALAMLGEIRSFGSSRCTQGLSDKVVTKFLQRDPNLILVPTSQIWIPKSKIWVPKI